MNELGPRRRSIPDANFDRSQAPAGATTVSKPATDAQTLGFVLPSATSAYSATSDVYFYFVAPPSATPGMGW